MQQALYSAGTMSETTSKNVSEVDICENTTRNCEINQRPMYLAASWSFQVCVKYRTNRTDRFGRRLRRKCSAKAEFLNRSTLHRAIWNSHILLSSLQ